jgi:hypothetical protein
VRDIVQPDPHSLRGDRYGATNVTAALSRNIAPPAVRAAASTASYSASTAIASPGNPGSTASIGRTPRSASTSTGPSVVVAIRTPSLSVAGNQPVVDADLRARDVRCACTAQERGHVRELLRCARPRSAPARRSRRTPAAPATPHRPRRCPGSGRHRSLTAASPPAPRRAPPTSTEDNRRSLPAKGLRDRVPQSGGRAGDQRGTPRETEVHHDRAAGGSVDDRRCTHGSLTPAPSRKPLAPSQALRAGCAPATRPAPRPLGTRPSRSRCS